MPAETVVNIFVPDKKVRLKTLLSEYGHSLTRVDGEKDHQGAIAERAENECGVLMPHFKKLAVALHKDRAKLMRADMADQMNLFDQVLGSSDE